MLVGNHHFFIHHPVSSHPNIAIMFRMKKLEWWVYQVWWYVYCLAISTQYRRVMDGQTNGHLATSCIAWRGFIFAFKLVQVDLQRKGNSHFVFSIRPGGWRREAKSNWLDFGCPSRPQWTCWGRLPDLSMKHSATHQPCMTTVCHWKPSSRSWKLICSDNDEHHPAPLWRICDLWHRLSISKRNHKLDM